MALTLNETTNKRTNSSEMWTYMCNVKETQSAGKIEAALFRVATYKIEIALEICQPLTLTRGREKCTKLTSCIVVTQLKIKTNAIV